MQYSQAHTGGISPITLANGHLLDAVTISGVWQSICDFGLCEGPYSGSPNLRNLPTGRAIAAFDDPHPSLPDWIAAASDAIAGGGFLTPVFAPLPGTSASGTGFVKLAVDVVGADTIIHLVGTERKIPVDSPSVLAVFYWRGLLGINGAQDITWSSPILIDSVTTLAAIVEASPVSDDVAIVYTRHRSEDVQTDNDVAMRRSSDGGLTWQVAENLTQFTDDDLDRAYQDVSAVFDDGNTLHIAYNTLHLGADGQVEYIPCGLWHWNDARNTSRVITTADWINGCSSTSPDRGGKFKLQLAKPSVAVKPAGAGPGAGIADEQLYVVWVQFGPTDSDCGSQDSLGTAGGYVNGEIYRSISSDDGHTWDRPENVTGTQTPNCLPDDCDSEDWVSAVERADSGLYLSYVDDGHAGSFAFSGEGDTLYHHFDEGEMAGKTYFMLYAPTTRLPVLSPVISVTPTSMPQAILSNSGVVDTVELTVYNLGNQTLNFQVDVTNDDNGQSYVTVNGDLTYLGSVAPGGQSEIVNVQMHGTGLPDSTPVQWRLEITSNDSLNNPGQGGVPIDVELNALVRDPGGWASGAVWHDINRDCVWDAGEPGQPGWTIEAFGEGYSAVTGPTGHYALWLPGGMHEIRKVSQTGWRQTCPINPWRHTVSINDGDSLIGLDFGVSDCPIVVPGDVNESGSVTSADIISLVGYIFKGKATPYPCAANGDVNCSGGVTTADVIYLVNNVFRGDQPPCDICLESPMMEDCIFDW